MGDKRELVASLLEGAGSLATTAARFSGDSGIAHAVDVGKVILDLTVGLIRSLGANNALKTLQELKRRVDAGEGIISDSDLAADDQYVDQYIADLFGPKTS